MILLSTGDAVKSIPVSAVPPALPANPAVVSKLSSLTFSWSAAARATHYIVFRNNVQVADVTGALAYRDTAFTPGVTYTYQVQAVDQYGQRSAKTSGVTGNADPALNSSPTVDITVFPDPTPTNGKSFVRINARDVDAQTLTLALTKESGSGAITPTDDPSLWIFTP